MDKSCILSLLGRLDTIDGFLMVQLMVFLYVIEILNKLTQQLHQMEQKWEWLQNSGFLLNRRGMTNIEFISIMNSGKKIQKL